MIASVLAAWLFCLSVPVGALPLVMAAELFGRGGSLDTGFLRWLLILLLPLALAGVLLLFFLPALYPWTLHGPQGIAGIWFTPVLFIVRGVVYLLVWSALAILNLRPPDGTPRWPLCSFGLVLHAIVGTLAATDWVMSLQPGFHSAAFGAFFMTCQSALALSVALLLAPVPPRAAPIGLLLVLFAAGALGFIQYLIIWSADRPEEIRYYIARSGSLGTAFNWAALLLLIFCVPILASDFWRKRIVLSSITALLAVLGMFEALWLVTPSTRGQFVISLADLCVPSLVMVSAAFLWLVRPRVLTP